MDRYDKVDPEEIIERLKWLLEYFKRRIQEAEKNVEKFSHSPNA